MQAPITNDRYLYDFYSVMEGQGVGLILDLTQEEDRKKHQIGYLEKNQIQVAQSDNSLANASLEVRDQGKETWTGNVEITRKSLQVSIQSWSERPNPQGETYGLPLSILPMDYLNFPIKDYDRSTAEGLGRLVLELKQWRANHSGKKVAVHCTAGVGRTGTIIAAEQLHRAAEAGRLNRDNLYGTIEQIVVDMRNKRGPDMVQTTAQFKCLLEYGAGLVYGTIQ